MEGAAKGEKGKRFIEDSWGVCVKNSGTGQSDLGVDIFQSHVGGEAQVFQGSAIMDVVSVIKGTRHAQEGFLSFLIMSF